MRIDVIIESDKSAEEYLKLGRLAEENGLGGVWIANNSNGRDAFVNFVPTAQQTEKIFMGPIAVSPFELHPHKMAVSLLTFNELSQGRGQIVIGAGGGTAEAMGQQLPAPRGVRAVRECLEIVLAAAHGDTPVNYEGELYQTHWLDTRWVTQPPPMVYVGANGPQMLKMGARYGPGIMVSDFVPRRMGWVHETIDPVLEEVGKDPATYPLNNFWAWHVKDSREEAHAEARVWLCVRGTLYDDYINDVVDADEAKIVQANLPAFAKAFYRKSPDIEGVPEDIVAKVVEGGTSASPLSEIDREVERFREFEKAGLTEIACKVYGEPERAIQIIGEHIVPALS